MKNDLQKIYSSSNNYIQDMNLTLSKLTTHRLVSQNQRRFQQYFSYIMGVSCVVEETEENHRRTSLITKCELTILEVIDT